MFPPKPRARLDGAFFSCFSWAHALNSFIFGVLSLTCGATPHERQRVWRKYLAPGRTNPPLAHCSRKTRDRAGKVPCPRTCRDAPSGPGTARSNEVPVIACGRFADCFRRRCFDPAPRTPGGAHAPGEGRSRRTLRGGAQPWGKRNRNVEPY